MFMFRLCLTLMGYGQGAQKMLPWIRKNLALVLIIAGLAGWGVYSVGSRMLSYRSYASWICLSLLR